MQLHQLGYTANSQRSIKPGKEFDKLFPKPTGNTTKLLKNAEVADTLTNMQRMVKEFSWQVRKLVPVLYDADLITFCNNIFDFVYTYIQYKQDEPGIEQLRTPARTWADRKTGAGVDCDCYSIFIGSILKEAKIPFQFRIIKLNGKQHYQHVYVIVPHKNGYITIDPVLDTFNTEAPGITGIKDYSLNGLPLEQLNGVHNNNYNIMSNTAIFGNDILISSVMPLGAIDPVTLTAIMSIAGNLSKQQSGNKGSTATNLSPEQSLSLNNYNIMSNTAIFGNDILISSVMPLGAIDPVTLTAIMSIAGNLSKQQSGNKGSTATNLSPEQSSRLIGNMQNVIPQITSWVKGIGNRDNTKPHPIGYIRMHDYFPGGVKYGQTPFYEPTNIGNQKHYEDQIMRKNPSTSPLAFGIPDLQTAEMLFITYGPRFFDTTRPGDWPYFWRSVKAAYDADQANARKASPRSGSDNTGPGSALQAGFGSNMLILGGLVLAGIFAWSQMGGKPQAA